MTDLADRRCTDCRSGDPPFGAGDVRRFLREIEGWEAVDDHHLVKRWERDDFTSALALVNRFGEIAEEQDHHPDLALGWGWVEAKIWTHRVDGLTFSDFVLAAHFDRAVRLDRAVR